jgi:alkylation response protein AidB-like acyl-CoA dehydrogenase
MTEALWLLPSDPLAAELQEVTARLRLAERYGELDRRPEFPRAEYRALGEANLLGLSIPAKLGGRGLSASRTAVVLHLLARLGGTAFAKLSLQPEFSSVLAEHGAPAMVERWFRPMLRGEKLVANHITEPGAGSDASALELVAEAGPQGYTLTGVKSEAAFAEDADAAIVYGRAPGTQRADGVSAFLVPQDVPGIRRSVDPPDLGERWQRRGRVEYDHVLVPAANRIGEEGAAFGYLRAELERERAFLAAIYLGVARASWEETVRYVGERRAFGRRLADQQAVAFALVEDGAELEASWLLTVRALEHWEQGGEASAETALAKVRAVRAALTAIDHAIQFHGGSGYSSRRPHEQRWRDVRSGSIAHGPSEVLLGIAARRLWPPPGR